MNHHLLHEPYWQQLRRATPCPSACCWWPDFVNRHWFIGWFSLNWHTQCYNFFPKASVICVGFAPTTRILSFFLFVYCLRLLIDVTKKKKAESLPRKNVWWIWGLGLLLQFVKLEATVCNLKIRVILQFFKERTCHVNFEIEGPVFNFKSSVKMKFSKEY